MHDTPAHASPFPLSGDGQGLECGFRGLDTHIAEGNTGQGHLTVPPTMAKVSPHLGACVEYLSLACRCAIAIIFVTSAASKLTGPGSFPAFVRAVRRMKVVPWPLIKATAIIVVSTEILIALLLIIPLSITGLVGFAIALGLLTAFTYGIIGTVRRKDQTPCRCFGKSSVPLGPRHIIRNVCFMAMSALGFIGLLFPADFDIPMAIVASIAGLVVGGLGTMVDDITELFWPSPKTP